MTQTLTKQRLLFCHEFLKDLNGTQAAMRSGYSKATANEQAARLLANVSVRSKVEELYRKRAEKVDISAERVLEEAKRIAFADVKDAFDEEGCLLPIENIPEDLRRGISSIEVEELYEGTGETKRLKGYVKKIKFWSKDKQIENLMKHLGLFEKDNEQKKDGFALFLSEISINGAGLPIKTD